MAQNPEKDAGTMHAQAPFQRPMALRRGGNRSSGVHPWLNPQEGGPPNYRSLLTFSLVTAFFVSPLLFFTDLTRNPYYLQITLLNSAVLLAAALLLADAIRRRSWPLPPNILYVPLAALLAVMALSFIRAYFGHAVFFRPSILSEFTRAGVFTVVNCVLIFLLAQKHYIKGIAAGAVKG